MKKKILFINFITEKLTKFQKVIEASTVNISIFSPFLLECNQSLVTTNWENQPFTSINLSDAHTIF